MIRLSPSQGRGDTIKTNTQKTTQYNYKYWHDIVIIDICDSDDLNKLWLDTSGSEGN